MNTVLHFTGQASFVEVSIKHGADIHATNAQGHTTLFSACLNNRLEVAQSLISYGSDVATITQDRHWLSSISAITDPNSAAYDVYSPACLKLVDFLVLRGADVHAAADNGSTGCTW